MQPNATCVEDKATAGMSSAALGASVLSALLIAFVLLRKARPSSVKSQSRRQAAPAEVEAEKSKPLGEITSLDGFDYTKEERMLHRPFKPIYHITMGASSFSSNPCCLSSSTQFHLPCPDLSPPHAHACHLLHSPTRTRERVTCRPSRLRIWVFPEFIRGWQRHSGRSPKIAEPRPPWPARVGEGR